MRPLNIYKYFLTKKGCNLVLKDVTLSSRVPAAVIRIQHWVEKHNYKLVT